MDVNIAVDSTVVRTAKDERPDQHFDSFGISDLWHGSPKVEESGSTAHPCVESRAVRLPEKPKLVVVFPLGICAVYNVIICGYG